MLACASEVGGHGVRVVGRALREKLRWSPQEPPYVPVRMRNVSKTATILPQTPLEVPLLAHSCTSQQYRFSRSGVDVVAQPLLAVPPATPWFPLYPCNCG